VNALRLLLIALGGLLTIAACGALVGMIASASREDGLSTATDWLGLVLVEAVLVSFAVGLFYLAHRIARWQEAREQAAVRSEVVAELLCPQCDSSRFVQGPEKPGFLFGRSYVARCLECGHRLEVSREGWRRLPLPEIGEAYETWADKKHLMRRLPMTAGQLVFVLLGLVGWLVIVVFLVLDDDDLALAAPALLIVFGCWWLGRLLFPAKRSSE
jgi:hypothetical protein